MSSPSDLDSAIHCLLVGFCTTFTQTVENVVQKQVDLFFQEERAKMEHWREVSLFHTQGFVPAHLSTPQGKEDQGIY